MDEERSAEAGVGGFLPPEPAGPEPELGKGTGPHAPAGQPPPGGAQQPPPGGAQQPPPGGAQQPPPGGAQQPPPQSGWQQAQPYPPPAGGWYQPPAAAPGYPPQPWGYPPRPAEPDNGPAVAGFVLSLVAGGLLLFSGGLSTIVSVGCAIAGIVYSRKGKKKVDARETSKNRGLAQAGFIIGIVALILAILATLFWILILVLALTDDEFQNDLENEFDESNGISAALRLGAAGVRAGAHLLG